MTVDECGPRDTHSAAADIGRSRMRQHEIGNDGFCSHCGCNRALVTIYGCEEFEWEMIKKSALEETLRGLPKQKVKITLARGSKKPLR